MIAAEIAATVEIDARLLRGWPLPSSRRRCRQGGSRLDASDRRQPRDAGRGLLAATAALRAGAGKLMVATGASVAMGIALALALAEARVVALAETEAGGPAADAISRVEARLAKVEPC